MARMSLLEAAEQLTEEELDYIRLFTLRHVEYDAVFAHANPIQPEEWEPLLLYEQMHGGVSISLT